MANLLITGVSSSLGQALVQRLSRRNPFRRVYGLDRRPPRLLGPVRFLPAQWGREALRALLAQHQITTVVHLAYGRFGSAPREAILSTGRLMQACEHAQVTRLVLVSRDRVYAPQPAPCTEAAPLRPVRALPLELQAQAWMEAERAQHAQLPSVVVRMAPLIGREHTSALSLALSRPVILAPKGADPLVQLLQVEDAAQILLHAATKPELEGAYNAAAAAPIPLSVVAGILEKRLVALPRALLRPAGRLMTPARRAFQLPGLLRDLHEGVLMSCERLAAAGYRPQFTTRQALALWRVHQDEAR